MSCENTFYNSMFDPIFIIGVLLAISCICIVLRLAYQSLTSCNECFDNHILNEYNGDYDIDRYNLNH
ncbi:MAG: hypothetical protein Edafosvirus4_41 [Edafosvirus sp.]|uniref:Uncharacterized protein n=1 Tax=Edafosvirus sp. TaxID=2487765 RepID=A0A3G4ZT54_9VIRU|nr:MAG: hypothetical protein Edafosvirus4_41 [Edafosvirus sp.]